MDHDHKAPGHIVTKNVMGGSVYGDLAKGIFKPLVSSAIDDIQRDIIRPSINATFEKLDRKIKNIKNPTFKTIVKTASDISKDLTHELSNLGRSQLRQKTGYGIQKREVPRRNNPISKKKARAILLG